MAATASTNDLPQEVHPIILGSFRFPSKDKAVLQVRSFERAIEAAKFFGPLFRPKVVLRRLRVINRLLDASENTLGLERVDKLLDQDVVKTTPPKLRRRSKPPWPRDVRPRRN